MEHLAKKLKLDDARLDESQDFSVFDMLPDEILEMIISFVPSKMNCFLVNKRFNRETINATRNRLILKLDSDTVKLRRKNAFNFQMKSFF
jgi:hypothetical protein